MEGRGNEEKNRQEKESRKLREATSDVSTCFAFSV